ncbi:hypothetical protein DAPK24_008350 [Pichia kluyveri]|uniref:Zn(2)-C6 fungal-type domain-containing protein n=1 Tax=Pichia kluyveri TaxID=36015 RepID=A0AAV5QYM5_PICKL|nr:hypothetical protein DAPK24_008350 [Pichia kluyveri]
MTTTCTNTSTNTSTKRNFCKTCDNCRKSHYKCDSSKPSCSRCIIKNLSCHYRISESGGYRPRRNNNNINNTKSINKSIPSSSSSSYTSSYSITPTDSITKTSSINSISPDSSYDSILTSRILNNYYYHFHNSHPLLPDNINLLTSYLDTLPISYSNTLLSAMDSISLSQVVSKNYNDITFIPTLIDKISKFTNIFKSNLPNLPYLQTAFIYILTAHFAGLPEICIKLKNLAADQLVSINIFNLDSSNSNFTLDHPFFKPFIKSLNIDINLLLELTRKMFWEFHYFDILIGTADGKTISKLSSPNKSLSSYININYPQNESLFNYNLRSNCTHLLNLSIRFNISILNHNNQDSINLNYNLVSVLITKWEMILLNYSLLNSNGIVNNSIHQSILLLQYCKIFLNRPFSYIYNLNDSLKHGVCDKINSIPYSLTSLKDPLITSFTLPMGDNDDENLNSLNSLNNHSFKLSKTWICINAANKISKTLIDIQTDNILSTTPLFACTLSLASIIHISSYIWLKNLKTDNDNDNSKEIDLLVEYLSLELNGILFFANHWSRPLRLFQNLSLAINQSSPDLIHILINENPNFKNYLLNNDILVLDNLSSDDNIEDFSPNFVHRMFDFNFIV